MINICADKEFVEFLKYFETFYNQKYLWIYFSIQKMSVDTILCKKNYLWKHFSTRKISGNVFHTKNVWEDILLYETCSWRLTSVWEMSVETFFHTRHVYIFEKYTWRHFSMRKYICEISLRKYFSIRKDCYLCKKYLSSYFSYQNCLHTFFFTVPKCLGTLLYTKTYLAYFSRKISAEISFYTKNVCGEIFLYEKYLLRHFSIWKCLCDYFSLHVWLL